MQPTSALLIVCLGLSQLIAWGALHYIIGVFGVDIAASLGWNQVTVHGGFSASLVIMGLSSKAVGEWIDRHGGRQAMMAGCWVGAVGCMLLAACQNLATYYIAWILLGLAMRLSLYDAAFASLVKLRGSQSQQAMTVITLFGGLASTAFWPLGHALASVWGWRGALVWYAAILATASLLHLKIPGSGVTKRTKDASASRVREQASLPPVDREQAKMLAYGVSATLVLFMQAGMAAHFIELLAGLGWEMAVAVAMSTLLGIGQVAGRLYMVFHGNRFPVLWMNLLPPSLLLLCYVLYFNGASAIYVAGAFALIYGAGNGISTITRGAVPVALFGPDGYGARVGCILRPAFFASAAAPMVFAWTIGHWGTGGTVAVSFALSAVLLCTGFALIYLSRAQ